MAFYTVEQSMVIFKGTEDQGFLESWDEQLFCGPERNSIGTVF